MSVEAASARRWVREQVAEAEEQPAAPESSRSREVLQAPASARVQVAGAEEAEGVLEAAEPEVPSAVEEVAASVPVREPEASLLLEVPLSCSLALPRAMAGVALRLRAEEEVEGVAVGEERAEAVAGRADSPSRPYLGVPEEESAFLHRRTAPASASRGRVQSPQSVRLEGTSRGDSPSRPYSEA